MAPLVNARLAESWIFGWGGHRIVIVLVGPDVLRKDALDRCFQFTVVLPASGCRCRVDRSQMQTIDVTIEKSWRRAFTASD
jgi:hypothetical protein